VGRDDQGSPAVGHAGEDAAFGSDDAVADLEPDRGPERWATIEAESGRVLHEVTEKLPLERSTGDPLGDRLAKLTELPRKRLAMATRGGQSTCEHRWRSGMRKKNVSSLAIRWQ